MSSWNGNLGTSRLDQLIAERYQLDELIKRAGGIETYLGTDLQTGERVVAKIVDDFATPLARRQLEQESRLFSRLHTASLARPLALGQQAHAHYSIRKFIAGSTLDTVIKNRSLTVNETVALGISLLRMLVEAHELGITHRDIKPSNVIVNPDGPIRQGHLIDFGFSEVVEEPLLMERSAGTIAYMSPEQLGLTHRPIDSRSDLFSLGLVLYESLSQNHPFLSENINEVLRNISTLTPPPLASESNGVPAALNDVIQHLLSKDVNDRYQTAMGALRDFEELRICLERNDRYPLVVVGKFDHRCQLTEPAFVGRKRELGDLSTDVSALEEGRGQLVFVEALSGTGKSRLLRELVARRTGNNHSVFWGQGIDQSAQRPFQFLVGIAEAVSQTFDSARVQILRKMMGTQSEAVAAVLPELSKILGCTESKPLGPEDFGQNRTIAGLLQFIDALGTPEKPALLIFDDCQWADELTLKLLHAWNLNRTRYPDRPCHVSIMAAYRSEDVSPSHLLRAINVKRKLVLPELTHSEIDELVESMAGKLPREILEAIRRLSAGSPFMASAILRGFVESGALTTGHQRWELNSERLNFLQSSKHAAQFLVRRLELLPRQSLSLLSAGAILGKEFDLELARRLACQEIEPTRKAVIEANARNIVWIDEIKGKILFVHDKLRESLLLRLDSEEKRRLHLHAAIMLEASSPEPFEIAYHYDAAGDSRRARPFALQAATESRQRHALDLAIQQYQIALRGTAPEEIDIFKCIHEGLSAVQLLLGNYAAAEEHLNTLLQFHTSPIEKARVLEKLGELYFKRGDIRQSQECIESGMACLGRYVPKTWLSVILALIWEVAVQSLHTLFPRAFTNRRELQDPRADRDFATIKIASRLAYTYWFGKGRFACGWGHLRGLNLAERYPETLELAQAYSEHAPVCTTVPLYGRALKYVEQSLAIRKRLGDSWHEAQSLHFQAIVHYAQARFERCITLCYQASRLFEKTGDRWEMNTANWHQAFSLYRLGRLRNSTEQLKHIYQDAIQIGDHTSAGIALGGWAKSSNGQVPAELFDAALSRQSGDVHTRVELRQGKAITHLRLGQFTEAIALLRENQLEIDQKGFRSEYMACNLPWFATALRLGVENARRGFNQRDCDDLMRALARISRRAVKLAKSYPCNLPHAWRERAFYFALRGRSLLARRAFLRSLKWAEAHDAEYEYLKTQEAISRVGASLQWPPVKPITRWSLSQLPDDPIDFLPGKPRTKESPTVSLVERFDTVMEAGRAIVSALNAEEIFAATKQAARDLLRAESVIFFRSEGDDSFVPDVDPSRISYSREMLLAAFKQKSSIVFVEGPKIEVSDSMLLTGLRSALCAPIFCRGKQAGCLYMGHKQIGGFFGLEEKRLSDFIVTLAGAALENAEGFARLSALNKDLVRQMEQQRVTERRLNEYATQLKRSNRDLERFAYIASHDLKEPLRMVSNFLGILEEEYYETLGDKGKSYVNFAVNGAKRMYQLVDALLSYSRLSSDPQKTEWVDFNELLKLTLENLKATIDEVGGIVSFDPLPRLAVNRIPIGQVFQNLIANAIKFRRQEAPRIHISATSEDDSWHFQVRDNGIGIDRENHQRIFEIFQRLHSADEYPGTGIGLAICKKTVNDHGGQIWVESNEGAGTTFHFTLPVQPPHILTPSVEESLLATPTVN